MNQYPSDNEQIFKVVAIVATAIIGLLFMAGCEQSCPEGSTWNPEVESCVVGETTPDN